jgi:hypothetical protein
VSRVREKTSRTVRSGGGRRPTPVGHSRAAPGASRRPHRSASASSASGGSRAHSVESLEQRPLIGQLISQLAAKKRLSATFHEATAPSWQMQGEEDRVIIRVVP